MEIKLSADSASILMNALGPVPGASYDGTTLTIPDELDDAANSIMAVADWDKMPTPFQLTKVEKSEAVNRKRDAVVLAGFHHDFGDAGEHVLDQRDARDETAWLVAEARASRLPVDAPFALRDANNETFVLPAGEAVLALGAMADWRIAVSVHSWNLKDAIRDASSNAKLEEIDIEAGWPGQ